MQNSTQQEVRIRSPLTTAVQIIILFWGIWAARDFLIPMCISALLAILVMPVVRFLRRRRVPEWLAISLSTLFLLLPIVALFIALVHECQMAVERFPAFFTAAEGWLSQFSRNETIQRFHLEKYFHSQAIAEKFGSYLGSGATIVMAGLTTLVSSLALLVLIMIITVVMVASRKELHYTAIRILRRFENVHPENMLREITSLVEKFIIARMAIVLIVGVACTGLILAFKIPYSLLLGSIIGILTFVPEIGFVLSLVPLILVSLSVGQTLGSMLLLQALIFIVHIIEGNVLTPKLVGTKLNINVLASFIVLFGGGLLWGVWGMLLSIPIAGVVRIVFCASPDLCVWGNLLAEREDRALSRRLSRNPTFRKIFRRPELATESNL